MSLKPLIDLAKATYFHIKGTIVASQEFVDSVKESIKAMTPEQINQLKQCKDTYDALKSVISGVIQDVKNPKDIDGWINAFDNFDKKWDDFAKEADTFFNSLTKGDQEKILENFAKNRFGEEVFESASAIKNNSANILKGIKDFKGAISLFGGSYRDPISAANKIRDGVAGIVSSTQKVAASAENIIKGLAGLYGKTPKGIPVISQLAHLSSYKGVAASLTVLNVGAEGMNVYAGCKQMSQCLKNGDLRGAISSAEQTYEKIKKLVELGRTNTVVDTVAKKIVDGVNSNRFAQGIKSTWNIGVIGLYAKNSVGELFSSIKANDLKGAYEAGKVLMNNVKAIVAEIENIAKGKKAGTYVSPLEALEGKSAPSPSSSKQAPDTYVCSGAQLKCTFGDLLAKLTVLPSRTVLLYSQPKANINDHVSMVNISPFGRCHTRRYPPTDAATKAAHGVLTPMPCIPATKYLWMRGKNDVLVQGSPALLSTSSLKCVYGGTITIVFNGQNV